jgi:predicted RNA binding protein YcfA (HicA-like mRNA interferase family)
VTRGDLELTSLECVATLQKLGFQITTVTDQHVALSRESRVIVVPRHQVLEAAMLKQIAGRAGVDVEELVSLGRPHRRPRSGEHSLEIDAPKTGSRRERS